MKYLLALLLATVFTAISWAADVLNINTANAEQIAAALKGVGMTKAEAIVDYREANGAFQHIDELVNVKGIGVRTVDINREVIRLDGETALASADD
ncbi:MAG: ComEA family DNA-binding protein [Xanthomonadales bacterium]|nr:ComEA family DNA-binding protein [Xanthomonadales bacterium]